MNNAYINDDILKKSVKIARVIDDCIERDNALSNIAQIQTAINCPEDALETIALIRSDDIRADAVRKSLDNLLVRYSSNNKSMPQLDFWLDKLMEDTMAIPEPEIRCPKLHNINLLILSRLEDKEKAGSILKMTRRELARLDNVRKRSKYLFAVYQLFQQMNDQVEAASTLKSILKRISEYRPIIEQGVMLGMIAHEYWKMNNLPIAIECIHHTDSAKAQSYGFLQLIKQLAISGNVDAALPFVNLLETEKHKSMGTHFIEMGKSIISHASQMPGVVISINKSHFFRNSSSNNIPDFLSNSESNNIPHPIWFGVTVSITSKKNSKTENDSSNSVEQSDENSGDSNDSKYQEDDLNKYNWDEFDLDSIKENHKEFSKLWDEPDEDDFDEDESDEDASNDDDESDEDAPSNDESDDDEPDEDKLFRDELFNNDDESDDDEPDEDKLFRDELFNNDDESDDDEPDDEKSDEYEWFRKKLLDNNDSDDDKPNINTPIGISFDLLVKALYNKCREILQNNENIPLKNLLQKLFTHSDNDHDDNDDTSSLNATWDLNKRFFCLTESIPGTVSFNRTLPPSLFQFYLRRLTQFFSVITKNDNIVSDSKERIDEFINRQNETGFDSAWQEVISQGNYYLAVECALNHFCSLNKDKMFFGYESSFR